MILIIGSDQEEHSKYIYKLLQNKKADVCYFDTREIPHNTPISWMPSDENLNGSIKLKDKKINLQDIKSVYWRWNYGIAVKPTDNTSEAFYLSQMVEREINSTVDSLYESLNCLWVNSPYAIDLHKKKPYQLYLMAKNGIRIPKTLVTNDKDEAFNFFKENNENVIFKPVRGGAHTEKLKKEHFDKKYADSLKNSPVKFQELIEGVDIRVYVVGNQIFAAEIQANSLDFRDDHNAKIVPVELPEYVKENCLKIMELFNLKFSGIDIKFDRKTHEYVFIEANPSPMFIYFEKQTGFPISKCLTNMLISGNTCNERVESY